MGELFFGNGKADHLLDGNTDGAGWAGEGIGVVDDYVSGFEDALDRAGFDVELVVAEAVLADISAFISFKRILGVWKHGLPLLGTEVPVRHSTIPQILTEKHINATYNMLSPTMMTFSKRLRISQISSVENHRMSQPRGIYGAS